MSTSGVNALIDSKLTESQKAALRLISRVGPLSRSAIARRMPFARSKLSPELATLVDLGLLQPAGLSASTGGRKGETLALGSETVAVLAGVDIDIDRVDIAITTLDGGIVAQARIDLEAEADPHETLTRCCQVIRSLRRASMGPIIAIGVGIPADLDPITGRITATPTMPNWADVPVEDTFKLEFDAPIFIANDTKVLALAELTARSRAGTGIDSFIVVKISTGIRAGIVIGGEVVDGVRGRAGEVGHICADLASGTRCVCGNTGCLESLASAPALVRAAGASTRSGASSLLAKALATHGAITYQDIGDASSAGDLEAITILRDAGTRIGFVLAGVIMILDPSALVVSSGLSAGSALLLSAIREVVYQRALPEMTKDLEITPSLFAQEKRVFGPAILAVEGLLQSPQLGDRWAPLGQDSDVGAGRRA